MEVVPDTACTGQAIVAAKPSFWTSFCQFLIFLAAKPVSFIPFYALRLGRFQQFTTILVKKNTGRIVKIKKKRTNHLVARPLLYLDGCVRKWTLMCTRKVFQPFPLSHITSGLLQRSCHQNRWKYLHHWCCSCHSGRPSRRCQKNHRKCLHKIRGFHHTDRPLHHYYWSLR